jgi:hypothetical protein
MRSTPINLVNSFSRETRGEKAKYCVSASLPLSKFQAGSVCLKKNCDGSSRWQVMNRFEVHDSNSTSDMAVHAGVDRLGHDVKSG